MVHQAGTGMVGAQPITVERPDDGPGPAGPGESYNFSVTPTADYPYVSMAAMVVQTNDVFLAFGPSGVALLDGEGNPRPTEMVMEDIHRMLAVWDAGTGQAAGNTGDADPDATVRIYGDATNDLAGSSAGGFANLTIVHGDDDTSFMVTLNNTSGSTVYPGLLTPVAYATHNGEYSLFEMGHYASAGLEALAEDGNPAILADALARAMGVGQSGVQAVAVGADGPGPITDGSAYSFMVEPAMDYPYLSLASMVVPSKPTSQPISWLGMRVQSKIRLVLLGLTKRLAKLAQIRVLTKVQIM